MGRIFRATTDFFSGPPSAKDRLKGVRTACSPGNGSKVINLKIFDEHQLANEMDTIGANLATDLENFLKGMGTVTGLDPSIVTRLSVFTFKVTYSNTPPTKQEIERFAVNDFPIYLMTFTGNQRVSGQKIVELLIAHKIPLETHVKRFIPDPDIPPPQISSDIRLVKPYEDLEKDWEKEASILGFGFPGDYYTAKSQTKCRKIGLIKMRGRMTENLVFGLWRKKLLSVMKHEIGHMLGLSHDHPSAPATLMADNYKINFGFDTYEKHHVVFVTQALESLTQS